MLLQSGDQFRLTRQEPHKRVAARQIENRIKSFPYLRVERLLKPSALIVRVIAWRPNRVRVKHAEAMRFVLPIRVPHTKIGPALSAELH
jgi:hypothetical protein